MDNRTVNRRVVVMLTGAFLLIVLGSLVAGRILDWSIVLSFITVFRFLKAYLLGIYCAVPVLLAGYLIAGRVFKGPPSVPALWRLLYAWGFGWAAVIALGFVLLASGFYYETVFIVLAAAGNAVALGLAVWNRKRVLAFLRERLEVARSRLVECNPLHASTLFNAGIFLAAAFSLFHALVPPDSRDELAYHLVVPRLWAFQHNWWVPIDNLHWLFPGNTEILWGYALAAGGLHAPRVLTLLFGLLTLLLLKVRLADEGLKGWTVSAAFLFLLVTPLITDELSYCYVEWPMAFFLLVGWFAGTDCLKTGRVSFGVLSGLSLGVAVGMKYTALPVAALLFADLVVVRARCRWKGSPWRVLIVLCAALAVFAGPWMVRNLLLTGDPLYPVGRLLASRVGLGAAPANLQPLLSYSSRPGLFRYFPWVYHATTEKFPDQLLHVGWPFLFLLVLVTGLKRQPARPWLTTVLPTVVLFYFSPSPRVYFPMLLLAWLFLPGLLDLCRNHRLSRTFVSAGLLLLAVSSLPVIYYFLFVAVDPAIENYLFARIDDKQVLAWHSVLTPTMEWIRRETPRSTRAWVWGDECVFYVDRWVMANSYLDKPTFLAALEEGGSKKLDEIVRANGIQYVFVSRLNCSIPIKSVRTEAGTWDVPQKLQGELAQWMATRLVPVEEDVRFRLYRVKQEAVE
jgi:hypothetical protein